MMGTTEGVIQIHTIRRKGAMEQQCNNEEMLKMKTSDFMDEAERQILVNNVQKQESNLLSDLDSKKDADDDGTG